MKNNPFEKFLDFIRWGILAAALILSMAQCGPSGSNGSLGTENTNATCVPTIIEGLELSVTQLNSKTYSFEICTAPPTSLVFSVYGGTSSSDLSGSFNVNGAVRSPAHITGSTTGSTFQITFNDSDNYFSIYEDMVVGGTDELDNSTTPLVQAHLLPGH